MALREATIAPQAADTMGDVQTKQQTLRAGKKVNLNAFQSNVKQTGRAESVIEISLHPVL
jgi:hypothetical protein